MIGKLEQTLTESSIASEFQAVKVSSGGHAIVRTVEESQPELEVQRRNQLKSLSSEIKKYTTFGIM